MACTRGTAVVVTAALVLLVNGPAAARGTTSPYEVSEASAIVLLGVSASVLVLAPSLDGALSRDDWQVTDEGLAPESVNAFDRWIIGSSTQGAGLASDVLLYTLLLAPLALDAVDVGIGRGSVSAWARDSLVFIEAQAVNAALTSLVKHLVARPRPYSYRSGRRPVRTSSQSRRAFWSGHTSAAFTAAVSYGMLMDRRHPEASPWVWAVGLSMAASVGLLRVASEHHFPSDVLAGAVAGSLVGALVPALQRKPEQQQQVAAAPEFVGVSVGGEF